MGLQNILQVHPTEYTSQLPHTLPTLHPAGAIYISYTFSFSQRPKICLSRSEKRDFSHSQHAVGTNRAKDRSSVTENAKNLRICRFLRRQCHYPELLTLIESASAIKDSVWVALGERDIEKQLSTHACADQPRSKPVLKYTPAGSATGGVVGI